MNRRGLIASGGAAALALAAGPLRAQGARQALKASDVHPLGYPTVEAVIRMGRKLEAATQGRLSIEMFAGGQLGGEKEMIEQAQVGALQIARVSVGPVGTIVDELNVFNLPFVFRDENHMRAVIDGPIGREMFEKVAANPRTGLVPLAWMDAGTRNVYTRRPIRRPEDLRGLKIRMMGNPLFVDTMNAMGGNGISMGFGELYTALQTGVVDGAENNPPTYATHNHFQVSKVLSMTEHLIIPEILVYSRRSFERLSKDDQALVTRFGAETQLEQRRLWDDMVKSSLDKLRAAGTQIVADVDKQAFQASVRPVYDKHGARHAALIQRISAVR